MKGRGNGRCVLFFDISMKLLVLLPNSIFLAIIREFGYGIYIIGRKDKKISPLYG